MTFSVKQPYGRWHSLCNLFHDVTFLKVSYLPLTQKTLESVLALNYYVYYFNTNIICYTVCTSSFSGIMMAWAFTVSLYLCYWWFMPHWIEYLFTMEQNFCRFQALWTHPIVTFCKLKHLSSLGLGVSLRPETMIFLTECWNW